MTPVRSPFLQRLLGCLALSVAATVFSGCATTWSEGQKAKLASIAVEPPSAPAGTYQKPDATDSPGMAQGIPQFTGGGLLPALIGSAIDASVTSKQQKKFESKDGHTFPALAEALAQVPTTQLGEALRSALAKHEFFGSRVSDRGRARISTEIVRYGFQKSPLSKSEDDILLRVRLTGRATLTTADGEILWSGVISGVASQARPAEGLASDAAFIAENIREAAEDFAQQLLVEWDIQLGLRKPHYQR
ncbi:MAG: hypothetical protein KF715_12615 [Candidatus Didemnitutus sp.]|nr:hypothetical protein [Candidatus Didemnitutus sp.]